MQPLGWIRTAVGRRSGAGKGKRGSRRAGVAVTLALGLALSFGAASANAEGSSVTVMTRNLYYGTDLGPVIAAQTPTDFFAAVASAYTGAQATDFARRAAAWADEIRLAQPDLVGLQEAVQWRTQTPADFAPTPDASTDSGDFVQLLLSALAARGLHYQVASESTGYDVEGPGQFPGGFMDVRLTQHEVILARSDAGLKLTNPQSGQYAAQISLPSPFPGLSFPLPWSWASVDVTAHGRSFRLVTTHLDSDVGAIQVAQAKELLAGPTKTALPVVLVGDLNSDADAPAVTGVVPDTETYSDILAGGFADGWTATHPRQPGYTCCEAEDLLNVKPTLDQRIDYVLTRGPFHVSSESVVGDSVLERLLYGRWPSDHAGVVARVELGAHG